MPDPDMLTSLGINTQNTIAGIAGGIVNVFMFKRSEPIAILGSVVVGACAANYLGDAAGHYIGSWIGQGASAFIMGIGGMAACQKVVDYIAKWKQTGISP